MKVVHHKKEKYDVYIGRPGIWGNLFSVEEFGRDEAIRKYEEWIKTQPNLLKKIPELKGKVLGCWCKPQKCHGDILLKMANEIFDTLLYGKDETKGVIGVQVSDGSVELFIEENGKVRSEIRPNKYWLLSPTRIDKNWIKLNGDLHYKYGRQFSTREEFVKHRSWNKKYGVYSIWEPKESCMVNKGITYYKGMKPEDLRVVSFDLETTGLNPEDPNAKVLLISNTSRINGVKTRKLFAYDEYETQEEMMKAWANWVVSQDPHVLTGHNIMGFDLNYLIHLAGAELTLGRDGSTLVQDDYQAYFRIDQSRGLDYKMVNCYGREIVDTMMLAYKYDAAAKKYDSYRLKRIIEIEGLVKEDREFYDAGQIRFKYKDPVEWAKIKRYCEHDADDALALFEMMATPYFYMTQMIPKSFQSVVCSATGSQINSIMMRAYLQDRHSLPKADESAEYEGAISIGNPGIYDNVGKIDVASLYPSIMIQYEVHAPRKDPNKYFLNLVRTLTDLRLEYKKRGKTEQVYEEMQQAFKILINSAYGFLGTSGLLFNAPEGASFITKTGREILTKTIEWAESKRFKLVNADTDSISYCKSDMSELSEEEFKKHLAEVNSMFPPRIRWEDDGVFKRVVVVKAKNYILYDGEKIKLKGSGIKATTKCVALKEFIGKIIEMLVHNKGDLSTMYMEYVHEIMNIKDITRWTARKTVSEKVMTSERANETKVRSAIEDTEYVEGDRVRVFYLPDDTLELEENFKGVYNRKRLLKNLFDTVKGFEPVIPNYKELCPNFSLVRTSKDLYNKYGLVEEKSA